MFFNRNREQKTIATVNKNSLVYKTPGGSVYTPFLTMVDGQHLLVAGASGSGKSVAINGIITSLLMRDTPYNTQFIFIDPKKMELDDYKNIPHCVWYADNKADIIKGLEIAVHEMEKRIDIMKKRHVKYYPGSNLYVVIDELSDIMTSYRKECYPLLLKISQLGRCAKIFLLAATQNVLSKIICTEIKCNFTVILGLRTATAQQSRMLIESTGCEQLPSPKVTGRGEGIIRDGADLFPVEIHKYSDDIVAGIINHWTSKKCIA